MPMETPNGPVNGTTGSDGNAVFMLATIPSGDVQVFVDRDLQIPGVDYDLSGRIITFRDGARPLTNAYIRVYYGASLGGGSVVSGGVIAIGGATNWDSAGNLINDAALELKLITTPVVDPYAAAVTEPNIILLRTLLKSVGRNLVRAFEWNYIRREYVFNLVAGQSAYPLPTDYRGMVDQTGWDRTNRFPLGGPLSPQEWQFVQAQPTALAVTVLFRPKDRQLYVYPPPTAVRQIAFEYLTAYWVADQNTLSPVREYPLGAPDVVLFDSPLVVCALKLAWKKESGFDTTSAQQDFDEALRAAKDDNAAGRVLRLDRSTGLRPRLLDGANTPPTGFGFPS